MRVIKIDPRCKYVIQTSEELDDEAVAFMGKQLNDWWNEPRNPLIVGSAKFKIVRIGGPSWAQRLLTMLRLKKS